MAKAKQERSGVVVAEAPRATVSGAMSVEERRRIIAEAAYYLAEQRGFAGGDPERDWLEAETLVNQRLTSVPR